MLQSDSARLDTVLLVLGKLRLIFSDATNCPDPTVRERIIGSLERRWKAAQQDVFIMAIFLNPYLRSRCFNQRNPALTFQGLWAMYKRIYTQMMQAEPDQWVLNAFSEYYHRQCHFTDEAMILEEHHKLASNTVSKSTLK